MECKYQEQVSAAVDRCLPQEELATFMTHTAQCPGCRYEYEMQLVTKSLLAKRMKWMKPPTALVARLTRQIETADAQNTKWWSAVLSRPFVRPAIAFALSGIALILFFTYPRDDSGSIRTASLGPGNVILQSIANYKSVMSGEIKPQMVASEPRTLRNFFSGKTEFPVLVPKLRECILVGGVVNAYEGISIAHVLYTHQGKNVIYVCQAWWDKVEAGEKLNLPEEAKTALKQTGWFSETRPDGHTVVLWLKGKTLCSAVSTLSKEDLIACLTAIEPSDDSDTPSW